MKNVSEYNVNRSAPNLLNICIDQLQQGELQGRLYHCYQKEAIYFSTVVEMIRKSEKLFDDIAFPQASTRTRSLIEQEATVSRRTPLRPDLSVKSATRLRISSWTRRAWELSPLQKRSWDCRPDIMTA